MPDDETRNAEPTVASLQAVVDGMRAEGCAALDALADIFSLLTPSSMDVTERERQATDIAADVLVTAKSCKHKSALEGLVALRTECGFVTKCVHTEPWKAAAEALNHAKTKT